MRAGLTQEGLAERAQLSVRTVMYLERGTRLPQPDTLARLAAALALTPAQQEALADAVLARGPTTPEPAAVRMLAAPTPRARPAAPPLVGREQELGVLRASLAASMAGQGGLVLLSGEAGVGKTALAEALCWEAAQQGMLALFGRCYDLSETPPYGPWTDALSQFPPAPGSPPGSIPPLPSALHTTVRNSLEFFAEVRTFFAAATAKQPLLLLLDDLQWADPASLDLLRFLARSLTTLPLLLIATYRTEDLDHQHPLSQLIPLLVREARAERLDLAPLSVAALHVLVHRRYHLDAADADTLVAYLARRTAGNALFATEMLRTLEERGIVAAAGTTLGDFEGIGVPMLLRQVVAGRVARLGAHAAELLAIAAVIGQEVPLAVWATVGSEAVTVETVAERGIAARLLVETREGIGFAHALIREAVYASIPAMRRRHLHRRVGEVLAAVEDVVPDAVAYHFQQAGDARAGAWLTRAAWRAYRSFAYVTARARFDAALAHVGGTERARSLLALSSLNRFREEGVRYAEEALDAARTAGDTVFAAMAQYRLGVVLSYHGPVGAALQATEEAERVLASIPDDALPELYDLQGLALVSRRLFRASVLSYAGRWKEAFAALGEAPETVLARLSNLNANANGALAVWSCFLLLGRPAHARQAAAAITTSMAPRKDELAMMTVHVLLAGGLLMIPYLLDDRETRQQYETELARKTRRVDEAMGAVPPFLDRCALLVVTGEWAAARALWAQRRDAVTGQVTVNLPYVGAMARAQGAHDEAWALVREGLPDGSDTTPGTTHFTAVDLYCLAARLALDTGEHALARQWLEAHDRWRVWAGAEVCWGRANGLLAWAEYHQATGDSHRALQHAEQARVAASDPRQPLLLLASHRLLGDLLREAGRTDAARAYLDTALALADACGAPYERALTLLTRARLAQQTGAVTVARDALAAARANCERLDASATLAHITALTNTLTGG
jgi:transcriptional regulator with XRE-family HTH domain/tetratricopeptide (TPR) repeat protein